jgi:hypothetical protein
MRARYSGAVINRFDDARSLRDRADALHVEADVRSLPDEFRCIVEKFEIIHAAEIAETVLF